MAKKADESAAANVEDVPQINPNSTKKEMIEAYEAVVKKLQEKRETQLKPEKVVEERRAQETVKAADALSSETVVQGIANLKISIGKMLSGIADQLEAEVTKYRRIKDAIDLREKEIEEIYGIERSASTLAALVEAHNQKKAEFEAEMAAEKESLTHEIEETRQQWEREEQEHDQQKKEREEAEERARKRAKDEYDYAFKREQRLAQDKFSDETGKQEKDLAEKRQQGEKQLAERERAVAAREDELKQFQTRADAFPAELDKAVAKAVKEALDRQQAAAKNREDLLQKEFDGERKAMTMRVQSLEKNAQEQQAVAERLSAQLEAAYQKVQDIAVKAIQGSADLKTLTELRNMLGERGRGGGQER
jgi:hypothetical protein